MNSNENMSAESVDIKTAYSNLTIEAPSDPAEMNICLGCE